MGTFNMCSKELLMNGEDVRDHKAENTPDNIIWCITIIHWLSDTIRSSALKRRQNILKVCAYIRYYDLIRMPSSQQPELKLF